ncbi:MAG: ABC transporter ATP-binding protein [Candidatus Micrarchaeaceae archaeon]
MNSSKNVLSVENLSIEYTLGSRRVFALSNVSLSLEENESIGIVGESGCGKSTLAMAICHILPQNAQVTSGRIIFKGQVIADKEMGASFSIRYNAREKKIENQLKFVRWKGISVVFQGALDSLNPLHTVGTQLSDIFIYKENLSPEESKKRSLELLKAMGLDEWVYDVYPHQLSGGMKQRVIIAMALSLRPSLIIADEPTTSLDVITQYKIIEELMNLRKTFGISLINISHDISLVSRLSDSIAVMYAGRIVEKIPSNDIAKGKHPYTRLLSNSIPKIDSELYEISSIRGAPPMLTQRIEGCPFFDRCDRGMEECKLPGSNELREIEEGHEVACIHPFSEDLPLKKTLTIIQNRKVTGDDVIVRTRELTKTFEKQSGLREITHKGSNTIVAVNGVELEVKRGEIVALVGETGSGKTTLSRMIGLLEIPTSGTISVLNKTVDFKDKNGIKILRKSIQTIFQDPFQSINPRFSVYDAVAEPLIINRKNLSNEERDKLVIRALEQAELTPVEEYLDKYPHQLSGGQRQRVSIARALVMNPTLLIADEPISMLDVSLRAGILNLLKKLRDQLGISILYITHDIGSARYISDKIYVMYKGKIVEYGLSNEVITDSSHPYTMALILASIGIEGKVSDVLGERIFNIEDVENIKGCNFSPRCKFAQDLCRIQDPIFVHVSPTHSSRCHFAEKIKKESKESRGE